MTAQFLARLEIILRLYCLPFNENYPVVCFDERPCFLIRDTKEPIPMKKGQVAKENYAYSKHGSCCILAALEPLTGKRLAHIKEQRTSKEFAEFMFELAESYPKAKRIKVVLDNLNTHSYASFYKIYDAETAAWLTQKLEFVFTPKSSSWLNMIEIVPIAIGISVLSRQSLNRRIPCMKKLAKEVLIFFKERSDNSVNPDSYRDNWQFTPQIARKKLNRRYVKINSANEKYK